MSIIEAIFLGILQGLTEFLPVSSSGHLEIGKALFGTEIENEMGFTVVIHGATVLSTLVIFYREILSLFKNSLTFKYNDSTKYLAKIGLSMIPVMIIGLFFKSNVESFFGGNITFVGFMLLITATFLLLTVILKTNGQKKIPWSHAFIIGVAQAIAVLPGISRSGLTITTGLLLQNDREEVTKFSFLMVLIPIIGANFIELLSNDFTSTSTSSPWVYLAGFIAAFISGLFACKWMISLVKKGNLIYFSIYCFILGLIAIFIL